MSDPWKEYAIRLEHRSSEWLSALMLADRYLTEGKVEKAQAAISLGMANLRSHRPVATNPATLMSQGKL